MKSYFKKPNIDIVFKVLQNVGLEQFVSVDYLGKKLGYSIPTIKCAGRALFKLGLLETKKGTGGGYKLVRALNNIHLSDLQSLIEHEKKVTQTAFMLSGHLTVEQFLRKIK